jgi:pilus assembly protein CpaF
MLALTGRRVDLSNPFVDARLPSGARLHVVIPDVTAEHWAINIRKLSLPANSLEDLIPVGALTQRIANFCSTAVKSGLNILVSGATQAGKTTFLNCLIGEIPSNQRLITIEEVFELSPRLPDVVALQTRDKTLDGEGEISLRRLIKEALRMRPSRIVVGEVREAEALDLLIALNSGVPGMASIHANSAREAIRKLSTLPLLAGENISYDFVIPTVANSIDLVIHCELDPSGKRRVKEIASLSGRVESNHIEIEELITYKNGEYVRGLATIPRLEKIKNTLKSLNLDEENFLL